MILLRGTGQRGLGRQEVASLIKERQYSEYCGAKYLASNQICGGGYAATDGFYLKTFALVFLIAALGCTPLFAKLFHRLPKKVQSVLCPVLIVLTLVLCTGYLVDATYNPFIYFRRF